MRFKSNRVYGYSNRGLCRNDLELPLDEAHPHKFIVVQKPYMERRSYATFRKLWPEKELIVTSPQVSFRDYLAEYANRNLSTNDVVSIMVGDLQKPLSALDTISTY